MTLLSSIETFYTNSGITSKPFATSMTERSGWSAPRPDNFTGGKEPVFTVLYRRLGGLWGRTGRAGKSCCHQDSIAILSYPDHIPEYGTY